MSYPLPSSAFGDAHFDLGYALATEHGLKLDHIMWDADELLWDWVLDARKAVFGVPKMVFGRRFGHHEFVRLKPGVWELIWGIKRGQEAQGEAAFIRISTNGYPWRLFRYAQDIPGFHELIGAPAQADVYAGYAAHPNIFCRPDYVRCMQDLLSALEQTRLEQRLKHLPEAGRRVIDRHTRNTPFQTSLKLPELAQLVGKRGFDDAYILIDDSGKNCKRFVEAGRIGLKAIVPAKHTSKIPPNVAFRNPLKHLRGLSNNVATALAEMLKAASEDKKGRFLAAQSTNDVPVDYPAIEFEVDIPDTAIGSEWFEPLERLKAGHPT